MPTMILPRREKLDLPDSPRIIVFRVIDEQIRKDPVISRTVRPYSFRSWRGEPADRNEFSINQAPAIRLTPRPGAERAWTVGSPPYVRRGLLNIDVEVLVAGCCVDDLDNLWHAIRRSLDPRDPIKNAAFVSLLRSVGAWQGIVNVEQPAFDPRPEAGTDGMFRGFGQLSVEYQYTP